MIVCTRNAKDSDIPRIAAIDAAFYGEISYGTYVVRQYLDLFSESFFVSVSQSIVDGYVVVGIEGGAPRAWLLSLCVEQNMRGRGIGTALVRCCMDYCESKGIQSCKLTVDPSNAAAISLYKHFGFAIVDNVLNYFHAGEARLIMSKVWQPI